ncbi:MAG TPA: hypothetical protein VFP49_09980 [Nitrososphaeraceae archaeon]|nr:hypothetical protein [Nitrososphaeraceae archaeon]
MIDRINIDPELSRPFDTFFEYEGIVLKKKIDQAKKNNLIRRINEKYVLLTFPICYQL